MKTRIEPYREEHEPLIKAMNDRLKEGGSRWRFYDSHVPDWLPPESDGPSVSRRFFAVLGDDGEAHGAYCLKEQVFLLNGEEHVLATWQGPVSEGLVDKRFQKVGLQCFLDLRDRNPLLFGWGGSDQVRSLLESLGWRRRDTPFLARFVRPNRVLREGRFIRADRRLAGIADLLAATRLGGVAVGALQRARAFGHGRLPAGKAHEEREFGDWSDAVWHSAKGDYGMIARRDQDSLARLMGRPGWPDAKILRLEIGGDVTGWAAVRIHQMEDDRRFGNLLVGSIIDALAPRPHEAATVLAATRFLEERGVDIIAGNVLHPRWRAAHAAAGFLEIPNRRDLFVSPDLDELLTSLGIDPLASAHFMPIDGDGPFGL